MAFHATISFTRYYLSRIQGVSLSLSLLSEAQKKFFSPGFVCVLLDGLREREPTCCQ